jgi:hypothetical protein
LGKRYYWGSGQQREIEKSHKVSLGRKGALMVVFGVKYQLEEALSRTALLVCWANV